MQELNITFHLNAPEVERVLNKMDSLQGSNKKQKLISASLVGLTVFDLMYFFISKNGFSLILGILFMVLTAVYTKRASVGNSELAKAFENDSEQVLALFENQIQFSQRTVNYSDISVFAEFNDAFGVKYLENYYFVIPKRIFNPQQLNDFTQKMKDVLAENYLVVNK